MDLGTTSVCIPIGETLKKNQTTLVQPKNPPHALTLSKYGIIVYRGSHVSNNERIEVNGFDGEFWIMRDMWLLTVDPMSEFREPKIKVCKVDNKLFLKNLCGGPPNIITYCTKETCIFGGNKGNFKRKKWPSRKKFALELLHQRLVHRSTMSLMVGDIADVWEDI